MSQYCDASSHETGVTLVRASRRASICAFLPMEGMLTVGALPCSSLLFRVESLCNEPTIRAFDVETISYFVHIPSSTTVVWPLPLLLIEWETCAPQVNAPCHNYSVSSPNSKTHPWPLPANTAFWKASACVLLVTQQQAVPLLAHSLSLCSWSLVGFSPGTLTSISTWIPLIDP